MHLPSTLFQWSKDSNSLVVFAHSIAEDACPLYENVWIGDGKSYNTPCWQLLDMQSGNVLWAWGDVVNMTKDNYSNGWEVSDITISPYGKRLALNISVFSRVELGIVDIDNKLYEQWAAYGGDVIRWKSNQ